MGQYEALSSGHSFNEILLFVNKLKSLESRVIQFSICLLIIDRIINMKFKINLIHSICDLKLSLRY